MRGNAFVCSEMVLTGFANNYFILALLLERYIYSTTELRTMKFKLVYGHLEHFLHFKLT